MKLAINYSTPAAILVKNGEIQVDNFKTPNWKWMIGEAKILRPVAIHFNLDAGNGHLDEIDWDEAERMADETETPYINLHLDPRQKHYPDVPVDASGKQDVKKARKVILSDIQVVVDRFGAQRIILENSPYRGTPGGTMRFSVEPELITEVVEETGCSLLLDISHAIISAHYMGMDTNEYFAGLPTHRIKELHFAGIHKIDGMWTDHLSIQEADWNWLEWALEKVQGGEWAMPWLLAFEYGGVGKVFEWRNDPQVIASQVPLLYKRIQKLNQEPH